MRGKSTPVLATAALLAVAAVLTGCTSEAPSGPAWTAEPGPSVGATAPSSAAATGPSTAPATDPAAGPVKGAPTSQDWKTYTDPGKTVAFDLPREWIAQSLPPEEGSFPGALRVEVRKPDGTFVAALRTGLPASEPECPDGSKRPYTVISSVPVELPAAAGKGTIPPRVVFRVIQGYRFFGSYGITNVVAGGDGQTCELRNVVRGPAGMGDYSFGDLVAVKALAPDEKVAPAKAFDTLDQAARYVAEDAGFADVQRMLMSLEIKN